MVGFIQRSSAPASQAERWMNKIQKFQKKCYVFIIFIITKFDENFEDQIDICFLKKWIFSSNALPGWLGSDERWINPTIFFIFWNLP